MEAVILNNLIKGARADVAKADTPEVKKAIIDAVIEIATNELTGFWQIVALIILKGIEATIKIAPAAAVSQGEAGSVAGS